MPTPFFSAFESLATPTGTWIKPGGQVVAYVRSTGVQSGDLPEVATNLVATIAAGVARCRASMNDIVMVLPGHTETLTGTSNLFTPVAGAQIIGCGIPGASNAPNVTISATGAGIALSAANMTITGLNINSATAAVTGAIVITGAGVTLANNFISFTGALGANPAILVSGAANCSIVGNHIVASVTATIISVTGAGSTNLVIEWNKLRQSNAAGTSANYVTIADTAGISGFVGYNTGKTAAALTTANTGMDLDAANIVATVQNVENYVNDNVATGAVLANGATAA